MKEKTKYKENAFSPIYGGGNEVLEADGFYISYNPAPSGSIFGELFEDLANTLSDEPMDRSAETALYDGKVWRILNGDFRDEYEALAPKGLEACIELYNQNKPTHRSNWSTD